VREFFDFVTEVICLSVLGSAVALGIVVSVHLFGEIVWIGALAALVVFSLLYQGVLLVARVLTKGRP
jgi:hypothetical protein